MEPFSGQLIKFYLTCTQAFRLKKPKVSKQAGKDQSFWFWQLRCTIYLRVLRLVSLLVQQQLDSIRKSLG